MIGHQGSREFEQRLGLGSEEAQRPDDLLKCFPSRPSHRDSIGIGRKESRSDGIDAPIGSLRAQDGDDQQLERVAKVKLTTGVRIGLGKNPIDLPGPASESDIWHHDSLRPEWIQATRGRSRIWQPDRR